MPEMTKSYTLVNGNNANADEVETNFDDIISHYNTNAIEVDGGTFTTLPTSAVVPTNPTDLTTKTYVDGELTAQTHVIADITDLGTYAFDGIDISGTLGAPTVVDDGHAHSGATLSAIPASIVQPGSFAGGNFTVTGNLTATGVVDANEYIGDLGGEGDPSFTFEGNLTTGMYGGATISMTVGGDRTMYIGPSEVYIYGDNADVAELRIIADTGDDCAIYFGDAADQIRAGFYYDTSANDLIARSYNNTDCMIWYDTEQTGFANGAVGTPSITWISDPNTGFYWSGTQGQTRYSANGNFVWWTDGNGITLNMGTFTGSHAGSGSGLTSLNASNISSGTINNARLPTTRTGAVSIESDKFEADVDGTAAAPVFTWDSFTDTGMFRRAWSTSEAVGISANSNEMFRVWWDTASSAGDRVHVAFNDELQGISGTSPMMTTTSVDGTDRIVFGHATSSEVYKSDIEDFALTDDQWDRIRPRSFLRDGYYVHDGRHYLRLDGDQPEDAQLLRRAGFVLEELLDIDLHLATEWADDLHALVAATVAEIKSLRRRVVALEAA